MLKFLTLGEIRIAPLLDSPNRKFTWSIWLHINTQKVLKSGAAMILGFLFLGITIFLLVYFNLPPE